MSEQVPSAHDLGAAEPAPARLIDPADVDDIARGLGDVLTDDALRDDLARTRPLAYTSTRTWPTKARSGTPRHCGGR